MEDKSLKKKKQQKVGSFPFTSVFVVLSLFSSSYFLITTTIQYYNKRVLLCEYPVNKKVVRLRKRRKRNGEQWTGVSRGRFTGYL